VVSGNGGQPGDESTTEKYTIAGNQKEEVRCL
jgi:hypothetical protein